MKRILIAALVIATLLLLVPASVYGSAEPRIGEIVFSFGGLIFAIALSPFWSIRDRVVKKPTWHDVIDALVAVVVCFLIGCLVIGKIRIHQANAQVARLQAEMKHVPYEKSRYIQIEILINACYENTVQKLIHAGGCK